MIPEIIEAYRSRSSISKTYLNKLRENKNISVNFNFHDSKGEFICYLGGHDHFTTNFDIHDLENENKSIPPQKMLLCTNQAPSEVGIIYNRVIREVDSLSSNSFCIYAIDTKEKKIYITFFGAYKPTDKAEYPKIQIIPYSQSEVSPKTSPNIYKYKFTRIYFLNINKEIIFGYNKVKYIPLHKKQLTLYDSRFHQ